MITYKTFKGSTQNIQPKTNVRSTVYLNGKLVGHIKAISDKGFRYVPKGQKLANGGEIYSTITAVKSTL